MQSFVGELVDLGGPLTSIVDHMTSWQSAGRSAPDALPVNVVLDGLLNDVLKPLENDFDEDALMQSAAVLDAACKLVCSEIHLVAEDLDA